MRLASILTVLSLGAFAGWGSASAFTVNANFNGAPQSCATATGLSFSAGTPSTVSYTCGGAAQTNNVCTMSGDLTYTLGSSTVDVPCSSFVATGLQIDATYGGIQNGDGTQSGNTPGGVCSAATGVTYVPDTNTLSWTCGSYAATCQSIAQSTTVFDLAQNKITAQCVPLGPTGVGSAHPSSLAVTAQTLLAVAVTPVSSSVTVVGDLSSIGGSASQTFLDDGTGGDATAGDGIYSFTATLPLSLLNSTGPKQLPVTIADATRSNTAQIALSVLTPSWPQGAGVASPGLVSPTGTTLLSVQTYPGTNPSSTGVGVTADLSTIGGAANQTLYDDGSHGDAVAGDGRFSFSASVPYPTPGGAKSVPVVVTDSQGRGAQSTIGVDVLTSTNPSGFAQGQPDNVLTGGSTLLTVQTTKGLHPTSTSVGVAADLTAIGGSASQAFLDDGQNGDAVAGDGIYSYQATVGIGATPGSISVPVAVSDSLPRLSNPSLPLNITTPTSLAAVGNRPTATVGKPVTLRVTVTPATSMPGPSTAITVVADLSAFGGSANEVFLDDGNGADQAAGDNVFTLLMDLVPIALPSGPVRLPATVTDGQGRTATTSIVVTVRGDGMYLDSYEDPIP